MNNSDKPAFGTHPENNPDTAFGNHSGLSKREYFAGKNLQALLSHVTGTLPHNLMKKFSQDAILCADELLDQLKLDPENGRWKKFDINSEPELKDLPFITRRKRSKGYTYEVWEDTDWFDELTTKDKADWEEWMPLSSI